MDRMAAPAEGRAGAAETVLANARIVLADEVVAGSVLLRGDRIAAVDSGNRAGAGALDCGGALLIPGLVELHTDNLDRHLRPRPTVDWPHGAAVLAHDREVISAGITTVFDALRIGSLNDRTGRAEEFGLALPLAREIRRLSGAGTLRADHRLHLRAELCSRTVLGELERFGPEERVEIISMMDHTPGQRQFSDIERYRHFHMTRRGLSAAQMDALIDRATGMSAVHGAANRAGVVAGAGRLGAVLASHDDTTAAHVAESTDCGVRLAEFPTTLEAARACRAHGIAVMMGAPNLLRGASHSGNVPALELVAEGLLDLQSSDYAPAALLLGAFRLAALTGDLPGAVATVTLRPAAAARLTDRGEIMPGRRADLVLVREAGGLPVIEGVWSGGRRVG